VSEWLKEYPQGMQAHPEKCVERKFSRVRQNAKHFKPSEMSSQSQTALRVFELIPPVVRYR